MTFDFTNREVPPGLITTQMQKRQQQLRANWDALTPEQKDEKAREFLEREIIRHLFLRQQPRGSDWIIEHLLGMHGLR